MSATAIMSRPQIPISNPIFDSTSNFPLYKKHPEDQKQISKISNSIIQRDRAILDLIKNPIITFWKDKDYLKGLWRFLIPELLNYNDLFSKIGENEIESIVAQFENNEIEKGFDSIYNMTSTFGWLK